MKSKILALTLWSRYKDHENFCKKFNIKIIEKEKTKYLIYDQEKRETRLRVHIQNCLKIMIKYY